MTGGPGLLRGLRRRRRMIEGALGRSAALFDGGCHAQASRIRRPPLLSRSRVSGGSHSLRKPGSSAAGAWCTAMSSFPRSSGAMICARAARDAGFKACCLGSGRYDGGQSRGVFLGSEAGLRASGLPRVRAMARRGAAHRIPDARKRDPGSPKKGEAFFGTVPGQRPRPLGCQPPRMPGRPVVERGPR